MWQARVIVEEGWVSVCIYTRGCLVDRRCPFPRPAVDLQPRPPVSYSTLQLQHLHHHQPQLRPSHPHQLRPILPNITIPSNSQVPFSRHFLSVPRHLLSVNCAFTSILTAPCASNSLSLAFFCSSCTRHFLKYVTYRLGQPPIPSPAPILREETGRDNLPTPARNPAQTPRSPPRTPCPPPFRP